MRRATEELCWKFARTDVEIGDVLDLHAPEAYRNADLATQIKEAAFLAVGAYNILFIHTDGAGDPDSAYAERVKPAAERIAVELSHQQERTVGVVPVREMEAWTLVDGDALRGAFGTVLDDVALGIPTRPRDVEGILDPKQVLNQVYRNVFGSLRKSKRKTVADFYSAIGERIQLKHLQKVPAFERFERALRIALLELGYISD